MIYECLKSNFARILKIDNVHDTDTFAEYCIAFLSNIHRVYWYNCTR